MRHDPVASPQDGTPTKQVSDKTRPRNRRGSLWARIHRQDNETPALNALKALRGAPISMGRGEIPVELLAGSHPFLPWFYTFSCLARRCQNSVARVSVRNPSCQWNPASDAADRQVLLFVDIGIERTQERSELIEKARGSGPV